MAAYLPAHKAEKREYDRKRYLAQRDNILAQSAAWQQANPEAAAEKRARYRATTLQQCPKWLTDEQRRDLVQIYLFCPPGHHVDHIIPLRGTQVRGLHVPWNLQYLSASENIQKGNRV